MWKDVPPSHFWSTLQVNGGLFLHLFHPKSGTWLYNWPTVGERVLFLLGKYCFSLFLDLFWLGSGKGRFWLASDWKTFSFSIVIWCNLHVLSSFLECFSNCFVTYFVTSHISAVLNPSIMKLVYLLLATLTNYSSPPKTVFCCSTFCQHGLF